MRGLRFRPAALAVLLLLMCRVAPAADSPDYTNARELFLRAMGQAVPPAELGAEATVEANDDPALRSYPLYPYLQAERIVQALNAGLTSVPIAAAADRRAAGFLATASLLPVGAQLRRSWLENLAQRSQWDVFLTVFRDAVANDALRCQALTAKIATGQTAALGPALVKQWLTLHEQPECDLPFAWGMDHGILTAELLERRARAALQAGNTALAKPLDRPAARSPGDGAARVDGAAGGTRPCDRCPAEPARHRRAARSAARRLDTTGAAGP